MTQERGTYEVWTIGAVEPPLTDLGDAPCLRDKGAPPVWIQLDIKPVLEAVAER